MATSHKTTFGITGMTCTACANRIEKNLNKLPDVVATVNPTTEKATVDYDPNSTSLETITETVQNTGYGVITETTELDVLGMTCAACSTRVEKILNRTDGVSQANVNLTTEQANIAYNPEVTTPEALIARIQNIGYDAQLKATAGDKVSQKSKELKRKRLKLIISAILSLPLLLTMFVHLFNLPMPAILMNPYFQLTLATIVQFGIGWQFYIGAYKSLRSGSANMDVLVALGTSAAYFYSLFETIKWIVQPQITPHLYFETSAVLITLILLGKYLEARAKSQTTNALSTLLNLQAKEARVIRNGTTQMIPLKEVVVGDHLIVKPGEKIPVDGLVIKGTTSIDTSMITGESMPVTKFENDEVIGSTMNKNGVITMEATKVGKDTALSSIVQVVEQAQGSKAPIQRLADTISGYFVPIVVAIAILTFIVWITLVQVGQIEHALVASIAVLVIACPCALGLATPTSIMVGTGKAAEHGILFKGGSYIEHTHNINTIVLDKTGTITKGTPEVTDFTGSNTTLQLLASAEQGSEHPLAEAIVTYAQQHEITLSQPETFEALPGKGIVATVDNHTILIGNRQLMDQYDVDISMANNTMQNYEDAGKTTMLIAINKEYSGLIAVADTVKATAQQAIELLHQQNIEVVMLTGDNQRTA
ncbi:TPA: copper-translocating P-type ATPase, partial [Escherichia coli]|nr:copper-translocating P-type ATPase [Escherichia coli]